MKEKIKKIAVTGGKGGTGKSTFSVLLVNKLLKQGKKVILVDLDVECPNDYLLLGQKLNKPRDFVYAEFPKLIKTKCKKCGLCVKTCRSNAIFQKPGDYPIFLSELCSACGACSLVCPHQAIKAKKTRTGRVYFNKVKSQKSKVKSQKSKVKSQGSGVEVAIQNSKFKNLNFYLVTGAAEPGLEETGPVVAEVKKIALNLAKKTKADYVLFDTAAGTHCPVIQALLDVDFAYVVTEPTPLGAYDLNLILDLCQKLKVPAKLILNQANLGNRIEVEKTAKKYKIKIEKEIPYSKKLVELYSKGRLLDFNLSC